MYITEKIKPTLMVLFTASLLLAPLYVASSAFAADDTKQKTEQTASADMDKAEGDAGEKTGFVEWFKGLFGGGGEKSEGKKEEKTEPQKESKNTFGPKEVDVEPPVLEARHEASKTEKKEHSFLDRLGLNDGKAEKAHIDSTSARLLQDTKRSDLQGI